MITVIVGRMCCLANAPACVLVWSQDMETIRILQEQYEKESKKANIPVPPIVTIDDYDKHVAKDFKPPAQYQKYKGWQRKHSARDLFRGSASRPPEFCALCFLSMRMSSIMCTCLLSDRDHMVP